MMWADGKPPPYFNQGRSFASATMEERTFVKGEVSRLLESGAIREAQEGERVYVSKAFLVPKKDTFRMIWDGRLLNRATKEMPLSFETLKSLRTLAQKGDYGISMDLADGFHVAGILPAHQRYLGFQCGVTGKVYCYQVLPFGWRLSPFVFLTSAFRLLASPLVVL